MIILALLLFFTMSAGCSVDEPSSSHNRAPRVTRPAADMIDVTQSFPQPGGAAGSADVAIHIKTERPSTHRELECRTFRKRDVPPPFGACPAVGVIRPFANTPEPPQSLDGVWQTDLRAKGILGSDESYQYYVHSSLAGAKRCVSTVPDELLFEAARPLLTMQSEGFRRSSDARLASPFIRFAVRPGVRGRVDTDRSAYQVTLTSLRRRFALSSAETGSLLLVRRAYASTHNGSCHAYHIGDSKGAKALGHLGYDCDAVVLDGSGSGVCLQIDAADRVHVASPDSAVQWAFGTEAADPWMWHHLAREDEYSSKCSVPGCTSLYLPDLALFATAGIK